MPRAISKLVQHALVRQDALPGVDTQQKGGPERQHHHHQQAGRTLLAERAMK
jgi:hypothetical protein